MVKRKLCSRALLGDSKEGLVEEDASRIHCGASCGAEVNQAILNEDGPISNQLISPSNPVVRLGTRPEARILPQNLASLASPADRRCYRVSFEGRLALTRRSNRAIRASAGAGGRLIKADSSQPDRNSSCCTKKVQQIQALSAPDNLVGGAHRVNHTGTEYGWPNHPEKG